MENTIKPGHAELIRIFIAVQAAKGQVITTTYLTDCVGRWFPQYRSEKLEEKLTYLIYS